MRLVEVNQKIPAQSDVAILFSLLSEREPYQNISHKQMPSYEQHERFIRSEPYAHWYVIVVANVIVGAIYVTRATEIGVSIFKKFRGNHFGRDAVRLLMEKTPGTYLANIAPSNTASIAMFSDLGFRQVQVTYRYD